MKKILLLSDTHSHMDQRILEYAAAADEVWHCGDFGSAEVLKALEEMKPLRGVYGNIDGEPIRKCVPEVNRFVCEGVDVLMIHIGGYPGKYPTRIKAGFALHKPDIFICGHSHILKVQFDKQFNCLTLNPGASGIYGFHQMRTMLRFEIDMDKIENLEVIELGIR